MSAFAAARRRIGHAVRRGLSRLLPYRPMEGGRTLLDAQYAGGDWDYLRDLSELSRFSVVAGYCHHLKPGGSILEIGCGEGLLADRLDKTKYSRYLGVDIAPQAIARAASRADATTAFLADDAATFVVPMPFDVIIFNECLEYFADPGQLTARYEQALTADGVFIASIFDGLDTARSVKIWRMFRQRYDDVAETRVRNGAGYSWSIKVLRPSGRG